MADSPAVTDSTVTRTVVTAIVSALVGALLILVMNSRADAVQLKQAKDDLVDLQKRVITIETNAAGDHAQLQALVNKVDDVWTVVVLGKQPTGTIRRP